MNVRLRCVFFSFCLRCPSFFFVCPLFRSRTKSLFYYSFSCIKLIFHYFIFFLIAHNIHIEQSAFTGTHKHWVIPIIVYFSFEFSFMRLLGENKKKTLIRFGETSKYAYEWISNCFVEHWTLDTYFSFFAVRMFFASFSACYFCSRRTIIDFHWHFRRKGT